MVSEYRALIAKVEAFTEATFQRRRSDFRCSEGCAACCHTWLTVSAVEADEVRAALAALPPEKRVDVRQRGQRELARAANEANDPRCAMLDAGDRCSIYDARPLVCRTQGHALRYPFGLIPSDAIARRTDKGDLTWCPLNYDAAEPRAEDVLDAERVDQILAVVAARHAVAHGTDREARFGLSTLAAETDVLHDDTARHGHSTSTRDEQQDHD
ncbi:MAG TPA: YkgJ family cysteine cluster protein [Polyangiales bacterium]|nr:YkgJ family cysteine cluster protein [Polyangiales bacterium]